MILYKEGNLVNTEINSSDSSNSSKTASVLSSGSSDDRKVSDLSSTKSPSSNKSARKNGPLESRDNTFEPIRECNSSN